MRIIEKSVDLIIDSTTVEYCGKTYTRSWRIAWSKSDQVTWVYMEGPFSCICDNSLKYKLEDEYQKILENEKLRLMREQKLERLLNEK